MKSILQIFLNLIKLLFFLTITTPILDHNTRAQFNSSANRTRIPFTQPYNPHNTSQPQNTLNAKPTNKYGAQNTNLGSNCTIYVYNQTRLDLNTINLLLANAKQITGINFAHSSTPNLGPGVITILPVDAQDAHRAGGWTNFCEINTKKPLWIKINTRILDRDKMLRIFLHELCHLSCLPHSKTRNNLMYVYIQDRFGKPLWNKQISRDQKNALNKLTTCRYRPNN